jgi:hypothetical protein
MGFPTIARFEDRNFVGICHFDVVDVADVVSVPQELAGNVAGDIVLAEGASWSRVYLEDDGGYLNDLWKVEGGDQYSDAEAGGAIAKDRLALMPNLWKLKGQRYLVVATTRNGDKLLMGRVETPAMARVVKRATGDAEQMETDRNEYRIMFSLVRRLAVPFYQGTVPEPEPGGECPTVEEQLEEMTAAEIETALTTTGQLAAVQAEICVVEGDGSFRTTDGATEIAAVPPGTNVNAPQSVIKYKDAANASQVLGPYDTDFASGTIRPDYEIPRRALRNSAGTGYEFVATEDLVNDTVPTAPDATYQRVDSASATIGSPVAIPAGGSVNVTCPDATYQRKDSAGTNIGSPTAIVSNGTANVTCPDGTVTVKNLNGTTLGSQAVVSNGTANYTAPIPLKFALAAGDADSYTWTVTDEEAGTYNTYTQDGGSGTLTYSKNGGGFVSLTGAITLAVSDTIVVRRTTSTSNGWIKWAP